MYRAGMVYAQSRHRAETQKAHNKVHASTKQHGAHTNLEGKLALGSVAGVGLAQDGVAVAGDDLAALERVPDELAELGLGDVVANLGTQVGEPDEDLLVGQAVAGGGPAQQHRRP